jgi:nitrate reductase gamma subunit
VTLFLEVVAIAAGIVGVAVLVGFVVLVWRREQ